MSSIYQQGLIGASLFSTCTSSSSKKLSKFIDSLQLLQGLQPAKSSLSTSTGETILSCFNSLKHTRSYWLKLTTDEKISVCAYLASHPEYIK